MSTEGERELIDLVAREQRGFRRTLIAGVAMLFVLLAMSAAMGVFIVLANKNLSQTTRDLQEQAFQMKIALDQQTNRLSTQERSLRDATDEIRTLAGAGFSGTPDQALPGAINAASAYLREGRISLVETRLIEAAGAAPGASAAQRDLLAGTAGLIAWTRSGATIAAPAEDDAGQVLPEDLAAARAAFMRAAADPATSALGHVGVAWVEYLYASSGASNYKLADCQRVFDAVAAGARAGDTGAQALWWQAQCERKLGRTSAALSTYARALEQSGAAARDADADDASLLLAMNAYHGVGTTLISSFDAQESELAAALSIARRFCTASDEVENARMQLALGCLNTAIDLRRRLGQNANQQSGSGENLSFAYLRANNDQGAFDNAQRVAGTGLFPWNELIRALTAARLGNAAVERVARRNVSFFRVGQFNVCEIQQLLDAEAYAEAIAILSETLDETVACANGGG